MDFNLFKQLWDIDEDIIKLGQEVFEYLQDKFLNIDKKSGENQLKVLSSLQRNKLSEQHFCGTSGYGYGDIGRELISNVMAELMGTRACLVSVHWVSGTHAIANSISALVKNGDTLLSVTGRPYETLNTFISNFEEINYREISVDNDLYKLKHEIKNNNPKVVFIQKSKGYSWRKSLLNEEIKKIIKTVRQISPDSITLVDNCYGEFVENLEPGFVGADLVVGSLIKNPGGGLAPMGSYVAGNEKIVDMVADELTAPGLGGKMGATLNTNKDIIQGLYFAPRVVGEALKGAVFNSKFYESLGYEVLPLYNEDRGDIIQAVKLESKEKLIAFIRGVQKAGVVDSDVIPIPEKMPGYESEVVMAAGTFVQGASSELSADAPLRPPYIVFFQGGLTLPHSLLGSLMSYQYIKGMKDMKETNK